MGHRVSHQQAGRGYLTNAETLAVARVSATTVSLSHRLSPTTKSGGGGNRTHACDCCNDHCVKDLQLADETLSTLGPRNGVFDCREVAVYASSDSSTAVDYIASAWPHLQPHVREAIMTLIDATAHMSVNDS